MLLGCPAALWGGVFRGCTVARWHRVPLRHTLVHRPLGGHQHVVSLVLLLQPLLARRRFLRARSSMVLWRRLPPRRSRFLRARLSTGLGRRLLLRGGWRMLTRMLMMLRRDLPGPQERPQEPNDHHPDRSA
jgi:hypothetical protein